MIHYHFYLRSFFSSSLLKFRYVLVQACTDDIQCQKYKRSLKMILLYWPASVDDGDLETDKG